MQISIVIPEGNFSVANLESTYNMFTTANQLMENSRESDKFLIQFVSTAMRRNSSNASFKVNADISYDLVHKTDLIIIPPVQGNYLWILKSNQNLLSWLIEQHIYGAEIASQCTGAFLLAGTGLLNGKSCTTHWMAVKEFRDLFPMVILQEEKILTEQSGIYTSAGSQSSLNLNLHLIEKFAGRQLAVQIAKIFEIDINRSCQTPFVLFNYEKRHSDEPIQKAQEFMEQNYREKITMEMLSSMYGISKRTFERRFYKATQFTTLEYLQKIRTEAAKSMLENDQLSVEEVLKSVGYADPSAFRKLFKKIVGLSPAVYRNSFMTPKKKAK